MQCLEAARAAPATTGRDPQESDRAGRHDQVRNSTVPDATAISATHHDRTWWRLETARLGSDWNGIMTLRASVAPLACDVCGVAPCVNPLFCEGCRDADARKARGEQPLYASGTWTAPLDVIPHDWDAMSLDALWYLFNKRRPTPQATVEAIMYCVHERGLAALKEPINQERLSRCDAGARQQINERIERLKKAGVVL